DEAERRPLAEQQPDLLRGQLIRDLLDVLRRRRAGEARRRLVQRRRWREGGAGAVAIQAGAEILARQGVERATVPILVAARQRRRHPVLAVVVAAREPGGEDAVHLGGVGGPERVQERVAVDAEVRVHATVVVRPVAVRVEVMDRVERLPELLAGGPPDVLLDGRCYNLL